jgi:hypothetical protein
MNAFDSLVSLAAKAVEKHDDVARQEESLVNLLLFMKQHSEQLAAMKLSLCEMVSKADHVPADVIAFCMHDLKWPEVRHAAEKRREELSHPNGRRLMEHIIEAYDKNWDCKALYEYYRRRT